jgi:hypothetical protein
MVTCPYVLNKNLSENLDIGLRLHEAHRIYRCFDHSLHFDSQIFDAILIVVVHIGYPSLNIIYIGGNDQYLQRGNSIFMP